MEGTEGVIAEERLALHTASGTSWRISGCSRGPACMLSQPQEPAAKGLLLYSLGAACTSLPRTGEPNRKALSNTGLEPLPHSKTQEQNTRLLGLGDEGAQQTCITSGEGLSN